MESFNEIKTIKEKRIPITNTDFIKIAVVKYETSDAVLDIRKWFLNNKNELHPTKQGIQIQKNNVNEFVETINEFMKDL